MGRERTLRWMRTRSASHTARLLQSNLALVLVALACLGFIGWMSTGQREDTGLWLNERLQRVFAPTKQLHIIIPATEPNRYLCQNLASAIINGYPPPTFLKWGESFPGPDGFMFKVTKTLAYLDQLPTTAEARGDLILLVDGYDLWFTLPPDVLLEYYFAALDKTERRLSNQGILGINVEGKTVQNTIIFSADHPCWPSYNDSTPACSLVPPFPELDEASQKRAERLSLEYKERRFLNSGTIMGPIGDIRDMMETAMLLYQQAYESSNELHFNDQLVLADLWGEQERRRVNLARAVNGPNKRGIDPSEHLSEEVRAALSDANYPPRRVVEDNGSPEFGISLDYDCNIVQIAPPAGIEVDWVRTKDSEHPLDPTLPRALQQTKRKPFQRLATKRPGSRFSRIGWADVTLGVNVVSNQFFALWHMPGEKQLRDSWWPRLWFHPIGIDILRATNSRDAVRPIGWIRNSYWTAGMPFGDPPKTDEAGAWSDKGVYLPWSMICAGHEGVLFNQDSGTR